MPSITSIKLRISEKLLNREFRKAFLHAQAADSIAISIRGLRAKRNKRQKDLAFEAGMQQSEISRIEQADYGSWTLKTLFKVADALDARLRIEFDPIEEVIAQYKKKEVETQTQEQSAEYRKPDASTTEFLKIYPKETPDKNDLATGLPGVI